MVQINFLLVVVRLVAAGVAAVFMTAASLVLAACGGTQSETVTEHNNADKGEWMRPDAAIAWPAQDSTVQGGRFSPLMGPAPTLQGTSARVRLPIEVIGPDGYFVDVSFDLASAQGIDELWITAHRLGYRDATAPQRWFEEHGTARRKAKGSVRINGGAPIDLSNETSGIRIDHPAKAYGGIGGGFYTVRFSLPVAGLRAGANTLRFVFNGTDGFTSGYRILAFNLRQSGVDVLPASQFEDDDPASWPVPAADDPQVIRGRSLWAERNRLKASSLPNAPLITASCADCHAADGRDLKYFNFSSRSIEQRAVFHGLPVQAARDVAAYIRSLNDGSLGGQAGGPLARPWNPPYQPAPDLDSKPATQWAAGGGLKAVLPNDASMLRYLFPGGPGGKPDTGAAALSMVVDATKSLNIRSSLKNGL